MTLYELDARIRDFDFEVDEETGEILNAAELDDLEMERDTKIENIALWIKNLAADIEAYKREKESFYQKEKVAKNKLDSLKGYLTGYLHGDKFKSDRVNISYRKSESVEIANGFNDERFMIEQEPKIDKVAIKKALKDGEEIPGVMLIEKQNIQIK